MPRFSYSVFQSTLVLALALVACQKEKPEEVGATALAWLHGQDGDVVHFRNDTLGIRQVRIRRTEEIRTSPSKSSDNPFRLISQVYAEDGNPRHSLAIQASRTEVNFFRGDSIYLFYARLRAYRQGSGMVDSVVQHYAMRMRLVNDSTLRGRGYATLLHGRLYSGFPSRSSPMTEFFYSKADGLVAYRTGDRRVWWREF